VKNIDCKEKEDETDTSYGLLARMGWKIGFVFA
jgi:hypothetical protein